MDIYIFLKKQHNNKLQSARRAVEGQEAVQPCLHEGVKLHGSCGPELLQPIPITPVWAPWLRMAPPCSAAPVVV